MKQYYFKLCFIIGIAVCVGGCSSMQQANKQATNSEQFFTQKKSTTKKQANKLKDDKRVETNLPITDKKILEKLLLHPEKKSPDDSELKHLLPIKAQLQEVWYYCAPTTVSMMLSAQGINVDQYELAKEMKTYEPYGTHNKDAIRILNKHMFGYETPQDNQSGYRLVNVSDVETDLPQFKKRVIQNIKEGYPMYYTIDVSKVYPGKHGEHNVIGIGYKLTKDKQDIEYLYYLDPARKYKMQRMVV